LLDLGWLTFEVEDQTQGSSEEDCAEGCEQDNQEKGSGSESDDNDSSASFTQTAGLLFGSLVPGALAAAVDTAVRDAGMDSVEIENEDASECCICSVEFSIFTGRYHCSRCKRSFCDEHCRSVNLESFVDENPELNQRSLGDVLLSGVMNERVCNDCIMIACHKKRRATAPVLRMGANLPNQETAKATELDKGDARTGTDTNVAEASPSIAAEDGGGNQLLRGSLSKGPVSAASAEKESAHNEPSKKRIDQEVLQEHVGQADRAGQEGQEGKEGQEGQEEQEGQEGQEGQAQEDGEQKRGDEVQGRGQGQKDEPSSTAAVVLAAPASIDCTGMVESAAESQQQLEMHTEMEFEEASCCATCDVEFSFFNRRHHCRQCRRSFCDTHCTPVAVTTLDER
jgi:hypothetical protein